MLLFAALHLLLVWAIGVVGLGLLFTMLALLLPANVVLIIIHKIIDRWQKSHPPLSEERKKIDAFIQTYISQLTTEYPYWTDPASAHSSICSPPFFETARRNLENEAFATDREGNLGDVSEQKMFDALKALKIGAFVIANINSADIKQASKNVIWKAYRKLCSDFQGDYSGWQEFQCDFLLFHRRLGVLIIEAKSTEGTDKSLSKKAEKFSNTIMKMRRLFQAIAGTNRSPVPIHAAFFCPNLVISSDARRIRTENGFLVDIIDKNMLSRLDQYLVGLMRANPFCWYRYWRRLRSLVMGKAGNYFDENVSFLCCYRRAVYLNEILSIAQMAKIVDQQLLRDPKSAKELRKRNRNDIIFASQTDSSNAIFLTDEQLTVLQSHRQCRRTLLIGPPGSGKSLVLTLALIESMKRPSENRLVVFRNDENCNFLRKLERMVNDYFRKTSPQPKRNFVFVDSTDDINDNDDVFYDEWGADYDEWVNEISPMRKRRNPAGEIFVVVTGTFFAESYKLIERSFKEIVTTIFFNVSILNSVMRGTVSISTHWQKMMTDIEEIDLVAGHGIRGPPVEQHLYPMFSATLTAIRERIQTLLRSGVKGRYIAVIGDDLPVAIAIATFLGNSGISSVTADTADTNDAAVVVDWYYNVLSMEWPFVIACTLLYCADSIDWTKKISVIINSRAIAQLICISFNNQSMMEYVKNHESNELSQENPAAAVERVKTAVFTYLKETEAIDLEECVVQDLSLAHFYIGLGSAHQNFFTDKRKNREMRKSLRKYYR